MNLDVAISDLRDQPQFAGDVADRVWRAWWKAKGYPFAYIEGLVGDNLISGVLPFAVVAHDDDTFIATASVIMSDMEERPHYSPWVAAVWVEPQYRRQGVGGAVVTRAAALAFDHGYERLYLCAMPQMCPFYERLGWTRIEDGAATDTLSVLTRSRQQPASR